MPSYPIVGAHYHPPASALLSVLPASTELLLRPEPTNPFDPNAVQVLLPPRELSTLNNRAKEILDRELPGFGTSLGELVEMSEPIMLGYIARKSAEALAPALGGEIGAATLTFASGGGAQATLPGEGQDG